MKILHISLNAQGSDYASLRYFWENSNNYKEHNLPLAEIKDLSNKANTDYYTRIPVEYAQTGQALYNWLDKSDRLLANALNQNHHEGLILAISTDKGLAHLPWELLHDGNSFLVEKMIIPLRWVSKQQQKPIEITNLPQNRPLNLLFMATSPLGVEPVLSYEAEEGQILETTKRIPLNLRVEESGWLQELGYLVKEYDQNYFDVFHLTGHATHKDQKPCFLTEDEYGNCVYSNSKDIADTFNFSLPSLIFLSGCRTGYASDNDILSMAEELLNMGAKAVLGWGEKVLDTDAYTASSKLYGELSAGKTITQALAITYQALIKENARDWHKLRLYVGDILPQALVTPLRTPKRQQLPKPITTTEFRDDENRLRVASREEFVGRRRQLQNCLRTLGTDSDKVGVLIHGMGGWGKSSIASRLWDRLPEHEKVLWWRQIDQSYLISKFEDILITPQTENLIADLKNNQRKLKSRFAYLFSQLAELGEKPFLLILDDFEWNLEPRDGGYILKPEVAQILTALVEAIQPTKNRIIITCRYDFDSDLLESFYKQGLEPFRDADLTKKLNRLKNFNSDKISEDIRKRALNLADGNPLLLEWLDLVLKQSDLDDESILSAMTAKQQEFLETIHAPELLAQQSDYFRQLLGLAIIYRVPVPKRAFMAVCPTKIPFDFCLERGQALGLIEVYERHGYKHYYRVSYLLQGLLSISEDQEDLAKKAAQVLDQLWWGLDCQCNEEQALEIYRLAFLGKEEDIAVKVCAFLSNFYTSRGQFRQANSLHQNFISIISNPQNKMVTLLNQGNVDRGLGLYEKAIKSYQQVKLLAENLKNEEIKVAVMVDLGICHYSRAKIEESINYYIKALEIASTLNTVRKEELQVLNHNYLGVSYSELGNIEKARYHYQQALAIAEKKENLLLEVEVICNLCDFHGKIGDSQNAITYAERAIKILETTKNLEDLESKATILHGLAEVLIDEERYQEAIFYTEQSIEIAKQVHSPKLYSENYSACACAYLYSNNLNKAWNAAIEANKYDYPQNNYYVLLLLGLIALKKGNQEIADSQFQATLDNLEKVTSEKQTSFRAWDTKFLALCGLGLSKNSIHKNYISDAVEAYQKARLLSQSNGIVKRVRNLFQILKTVDHEKRLNSLQTLIKTTCLN